MAATDPGSRVGQPSAGYLRTIRALDKLTLWTAWAFAVLVVPLVLANTIEVFMRYVLGQPTDWAMETTVMTYGSLFMLGAAYEIGRAHV